MNNRLLIGCLILCLQMFSTIYAVSQTTWTGMVNDQWNIPGNWNTGVIPQATDSVILLGGHIVVMPSGFSGQVGYLYLPFDSKLELDSGSLLSIEGGSGILNEGTIECDGMITIDGSMEIALENQNTFTLTSGMLEIRNATGIGIRNEAQFNGQGKVSINKTFGDAILNYGIFINDDAIVIDSVIGVAVFNRGNFENHSCIELTNILDDTSSFEYGILNFRHFVNSGKIELRDIHSGAIVNNENFLNHGDIDFIDISGYCITNQDSIWNTSTGRLSSIRTYGGISNRNSIGDPSRAWVSNEGMITIDSLEFGISNYGTVVNAGHILCSRIYRSGLSNRDSLKNKVGGTIFITDYLGSGTPVVRNEPSANILNEGNIQISNSIHIGLENRGRLENNGFLNVSNTWVAISNHDSLINGHLGTIDLKNLISTALVNSDMFQNKGLLKVDSSYHGITNSDTLINSGQIMISAVENDCIKNNSLFYNDSSGLLEVLDHRGSVGDGIDNNYGSALLNFGKISIQGVPGNGIKGYFENYDSIIISNVGSAGIEGSGIDLSNHGFLQLSSIGMEGIKARNFTNDSTISISNTILKGMEITRKLDNSGSIALNSTHGLESIDLHNAGTVVIDSSFSSALFVFDSLVNESSLVISNCDDRGLRLYNNFLNTTSGLLQIDNARIGLESGIADTGDPSNTLENNGNITITRCTEYGLLHHCTLLNSTSGTINLIDNLEVPMELSLGATLKCLGILTIGSW